MGCSLAAASAKRSSGQRYAADAKKPLLPRSPSALETSTRSGSPVSGENASQWEPAGTESSADAYESFDESNHGDTEELRVETVFSDDDSDDGYLARDLPAARIAGATVVAAHWWVKLARRSLRVRVEARLKERQHAAGSTPDLRDPAGPLADPARQERIAMQVAYERVAQKLVEAGGGEAVLSRAFGGLALAGGGAGQGGREPRPEAPAGDESEDDDAADRISALLDALELVDGWEVPPLPPSPAPPQGAGVAAAAPAPGIRGFGVAGAPAASRAERREAEPFFAAMAAARERDEATAELKRQLRSETTGAGVALASSGPGADTPSFGAPTPGFGSKATSRNRSEVSSKATSHARTPNADDGVDEADEDIDLLLLAVPPARDAWSSSLAKDAIPASSASTDGGLSDDD